MVALACARMLNNGVTCTIQANVSFGGGDYEAQIRAMLAAYDQSGMRAAVCVGAQDQGWIVYPQQDEEAFLAGLPDDVREEFGTPRRTAYAGDAAANHDDGLASWRSVGHAWSVPSLMRGGAL